MEIIDSASLILWGRELFNLIHKEYFGTLIKISLQDFPDAVVIMSRFILKTVTITICLSPVNQGVDYALLIIHPFPL